jgi:hypothetical protein
VERDEGFYFFCMLDQAVSIPQGEAKEAVPLFLFREHSGKKFVVKVAIISSQKFSLLSHSTEHI